MSFEGLSSQETNYPYQRVDLGSGGLLAVQATADVTDLVLPGLDGDRDGRYYVEGCIIVPALTDVRYVLRPNGLLVNQGGAQVGDFGGVFGTGDWGMCLQTTAGLAGPVMFTFEAWISGQRVVGSSPVFRSMIARTLVTFSNGSNLAPAECTGCWRDTATNLTSLNLVCSVANGILAGSSMTAFRSSAPFEAA